LVSRVLVFYRRLCQISIQVVAGRVGRILEEGIKEVGKGIYEGQVELSDNIVYNAIMARHRHIVSVLHNSIDFREGNYIICSLEVDVLFDKGRW
jgi:hypothetical protein